MITGKRRDMANEYNESVSRLSLSCGVVALCFTRIIPAGIINAINRKFRVQKPAAARTDAATIAVSINLIFFMV